MRRNNKGQFSIIAALLVAVILVASVMSTYSAIRYNNTESQPQTLTAIDEVNQALSKLLGFTVGYYGSVLQVTGNTSYAQGLARNYLNSGLKNIVEIHPEYAMSFTVKNMSLQIAWYATESYSSGQLTVGYDLTGLGLYGMSYTPQCRLDMQMFKSDSGSPAYLSLLQDESKPLSTLTSDNFRFYYYVDSDQAWELVPPPSAVQVYLNGTYIINTPIGVDANMYVLQVKDARGLMVVGSSYNGYVSPLVWNSSYANGDYVDISNSSVSSPPDIGTHSNFTIQQSPSTANFDVLTEAISSTLPTDFYPTSFTLSSSTTNLSGGLSDLQAERGGYMQFRSYPSAFGTSNTFGQTSQSGTSSSQFSSIRGARYTCTTGGQANSISAYLAFAPSTITNLGNTGTSTTTYTSIEGSIVGQRVTTPASQIYVQSISTYIYCSTTAKNMKAAIYDNNGNLVATTNEISVPTGTGSQTFTFSSHPLLQASTNYVLVVWSASGNGEARLYASSTTTGVGRSYSLAYGSWPNPVTFSQNTNNYEIYCTYYQPAKAQCAIYSSNGGSRLGVTDEVSLTSSSGGWVTFPFTTKPTLAASTDYVLMAWSGDSSNVNLYYQSSGSAERFQSSGTVNYNTWPSTVADQSSARQYCIYCTYSQATQHTAGVEFTGTSNTLDWTQLVWKLNGTLTASADVTVQLRNQVTGQYPTSGSGFATSLNTQNTNGTWTITTSPTDFRDSAGSGEWRIKVTAVSASQFDLNLDLVRYTPTTVYYGLDLEEQWTNVNITQPKQNLCIKTGALSSETLMVDAWNNQSGSPRWDSLFNSTNSLLQNQWNNISVTQYMTSPTFTIRFKCGLTGDTYQDSWNISSVLLMVQPDLGFLLSQQDSTTVVEWLENGTMRQFGQNLQLNNQEKPIPPIPVRSIHLNQSFVNGTVKEIPFQVEDWASQYRIPLGMSNNETVFSNRQMIVFQMTTSVTQVTLWWDGRDIANQTSLAFANTRFTDNPTSGSLNNGKLTLQFGGSFNPVTSTLGNVTTTANFMRINGENSTYGAGLAYVIYNGVVRDVVQQEAEWSGGAGTSNDCPDLYANTVLTLPAGTSYYTYQLRLMFINSTSHPRTISDLCPIQLASTISNFAQTENGTLGTSPIVVNGTGLFSNYASTGNWTAHHWSQLINNATGAGSGIMFTDNNNQELYFFDAAGASPARTGALNVNTTTRIIELAPVSSIHTVTGYTTPSGDDITWKGAVVTFDSSTTPVYKVNGDGSQSGLWILVEYQPKIAVNPIV